MNQFTSCHCCGAKSSLWLSTKDRNRNISDEEFGYYRCVNCGLVFIDPIPEALSQYYEGGYQRIPESIDQLRELASKERYRLAPILDKCGGDLLEIGPWIGIFSINAKDAGFNVDVIEMNAEASNFLRDVVGIKVTNTNDPCSALINADKRYDVIALWHSLEHLPKPWEVLEAAAKRLKPGGKLLIAIPNIDSWQAIIMQKYWWHLDAPRHLYFWPPNDLERLVNQLGLITEKLETNDRLSDLLSVGAWQHFFEKVIKVKYIRGAFVGLGAPILAKFSQKTGRGAGLTATFRAPV